MEPRPEQEGLLAPDQQELVTFMLEEDLFAIRVEELLEVNRDLSWTPMPGAPATVRGAANLRGHIITIIDLRQVLEYPPTDDSEPDCVLIVPWGDEMVGILVDDIADVVQVPRDSLAPPPANMPPRRLARVAAVTTTDEGLVAILNPGAVLDPNPRLPREAAP